MKDRGLARGLLGREGLLIVGLGATLLLLLAHALYFWFLTDDAYISFRYARNLAQGSGLVFNPGLERVEGYTNFLWVVMLAGFAGLGLAPQLTAPLLSLGATIVLWALVVSYALRNPPLPERRWLILVPPALLAATRSIAVWSTSGLETRLFEVLVLGAALRQIREIRAESTDARQLRPFAGLLFALAALTRPDAILMYGSVLAVSAIALARGNRPVLRRLAPGVAVFVAGVGTHLVFRRLYYGAWLPNTWYAKVGGRFWWEMGFAHHASLVLEYAAYLWLPLILLSVVWHVRRGSGFVPALFAAIVLPHALYVAAIGGDHFEYRPQDLYFPFAFLLVYDGFRSLRAGRGRTFAILGALAVIALGLVALPRQSHRQFPDRYPGGFPGALGGREARTFLEPARDPIHGVPILRRIADAHRRLLHYTTAAFVGIRQEEHRLFLDQVRPEAEALRDRVRDGLLPVDAYFALDSVGLLSYAPDLRVLDRLGLNDAHVARSGALRRERLLGHERRASLDYARQRGVDFWALDPVHVLWDVCDPRLPDRVTRAVSGKIPAYYADAGGARYLVALLPQGVDSAQRRFPRLEFHSLLDPTSLRALHRRTLQCARADP